MFKLVWEASPIFTIIVIVIRIVHSLLPLTILWVGKLIIDAVMELRGNGRDLRELWKLVAIEITLVVLRDLLSRLSVLIETMLAELANRLADIRVMTHSSTLDLNHFENPEFYDQLDRARQQNSNRLSLLMEFILIIQDLLTLFSLGAALFIFNKWLLLFLIVTVLPMFFGETHFATLSYLLFRYRTSERRYLGYLCYIGASKEVAKEIKLFGYSSWLINRFAQLSQQYYAEKKNLFIRKTVVLSMFSIIGIVGYYTAYITILGRAVDGDITLGMLTFLAGSFTRARDTIQRNLMGISNLVSQALYLKELFDFFEIKPAIISPPEAPAVSRPIRNGIVFENVSFRYPGNDRWTVHNLNFELRPGERIALVGENGAGKTTITKLIARLYDPTNGRILLDGKDIREYDIQSLRQAIGVIFQDFVCYDLPFDENIGIGDIEKVKPYLDELDSRTDGNRRNGACTSISNTETMALPIPTCIAEAAEKSLASILLLRLPQGYRQMLGRRFEQGVELSGGEWQKIALARAYMRNAQILILDEPTAALDARAEYDVFKRFAMLVTGRTALIISHRFSTVRMAERIIVLKDGAVEEQGTHDALIARRGLYADLFHLQASGYR